MAGQKARHRGRVIDLIGGHRVDETDVIGHGSNVRQPFTDHRARLTVLQEFRAGRHDELLLIRRHRRQPLTLPNARRQFLACPLGQSGFVIIQLDLRRPARLGEEDDSLGFRGEVPHVRQLCALRGIAQQQIPQGGGTEIESRLLQEQSPGQLRLWLGTIHG